MRFFFDNCLPIRLAEAISRLEEPDNKIVHLQHRFKPDTPDEYWMAALTKEKNWVVVSGDSRITRTPQLRGIWSASGLTSFFLKKQWMSAKLWDQAWMLIKRWPDIRNQAQLVTPGSGFFVPYGGSGKFEPVPRLA